MGAADSVRLPSFRKPPLEEVALAVQFQPNAFDYLRMGRVAEAVQDLLPRRQEQPGRPPMREDFGPQVRPPFELQLLSAAPPPRLWFLNEDGTRLLQLQDDLVAYNWRRSPEGAPIADSYPRYTRLRSEFLERYEQIEEIAANDEITLATNWCEVTYINHITPDEAGASRPEMRQLLRGVDTTTSGFLPPPEDGQFVTRYLIPGQDEPRGRLTVATASALRNTDLEQIWVMTLTARVRAEAETRDAAFDALDVGHEWVVRAFAELTSDAMHERWEEEVNSAAR